MSRRFCAAAALLGLAATRAAAQPAPPADTVPAPRAPAGPSRLAVHGYLNQAAGISRGGLMYGIPAGGTVDYRRVAMLARFAATPADRLVLQVANRRIGESPTREFQPSVKVDWAFYERALGDAGRVRVGRIPLPLGIYNETRYVGTLLPFNAAPPSVYREREFSSESADGASVTGRFLGESSTPIEVTVFGGRMDYVEAGPFFAPAEMRWVYLSRRARARSAYGTQLWIETPVPGLRIGGGAIRARLTEGAFRRPGTTTAATLWTTSFDGDFDRVMLRAETFGGNLDAIRVRAGYAQLGVRVAGPLTLNAQWDRTGVTSWPARLIDGFPDIRLRIPGDDWALGAAWRLAEPLRFKVEGHVSRGHFAEEGLDLTAAARRGRYFIASLAAEF